MQIVAVCDVEKDGSKGVLYGAVYSTFLTQTVKSVIILIMNLVFSVPLAGVLALISFVIGFFGIHVPYIHESGLIGIGFSLVVVVIAALNLVLDFDFIERGVAMEAPKYMEWYGGFSLLVTLVWLYLEVLRLLAKLNDRK